MIRLDRQHRTCQSAMPSRCNELPETYIFWTVECTSIQPAGKLQRIDETRNKQLKPVHDSKPHNEDETPAVRSTEVHGAWGPMPALSLFTMRWEWSIIVQQGLGSQLYYCVFYSVIKRLVFFGLRYTVSLYVSCNSTYRLKNPAVEQSKILIDRADIQISNKSASYALDHCIFLLKINVTEILQSWSCKVLFIQ